MGLPSVLKVMDINQINARLRLHYGCNLFKMPNFRLVFSDNQFEKRWGTFREFYGKIFLREYTAMKEVPKYGFIKGKWVLERWLPPSLTYTPEVPDSSNGSYEPMYVFQDVNGNALEVNEEFIDKCVDTILHPQLAGHRASELREADKKAKEKEIQENMVILEDQGRSWIGHRLHSKEGIIVPGGLDK